jgi:arylformamidase
MVYDLTHLIRENIQVWPGTPGPQISTLFTVENNGFMETQLSLVSHTGTHMDAPAHMIKNGLTLDRLPISHFIGLAVKIDLTHCCRLIQAEDIESLLHLDFPFNWVLLHTGWSRYWGHQAYFGHYPVLTEKAAYLLSKLPLKGIGIDAPSFDAFDSKDYPNHHLLLGKNILFVENLRGLEPLPTGHMFSFSALPLHYVNADGAPVRAMAII